MTNNDKTLLEYLNMVVMGFKEVEKDVYVESTLREYKRMLGIKVCYQ